MDAMKDGLAVLAGIVGLLTTFLTLYAKYLDVKQSAAAKANPAEPAKPTTYQPEPATRPVPLAGPFDPPGWYTPPAARYVPPTWDPSNVERTRGLLRGPAITMIVVGSLSVLFNLGIAVFGFVDEFVTPLTTDSRAKQAAIASFQPANPEFPSPMMGSRDDRSEKLNAGMAMFLLMSLCLPSAVAIWAGINMLRLRGYWISVVGSFGIIAGASLACCMTGAPIGVWSLVILFSPRSPRRSGDGAFDEGSTHSSRNEESSPGP